MNYRRQRRKLSESETTPLASEIPSPDRESQNSPRESNSLSNIAAFLFTYYS